MNQTQTKSDVSDGSVSAAIASMPPIILSPVELPLALLPGELEELALCERLIERGMETFIEVGNALAIVRDKKLYRDRYATWDDYCQQRWHFTARRARQLCAAAETMRSLGFEPGTSPIFAMPACERHVRLLNDLPLEERKSAWSEAIATLPSGKLITSRHLGEVVRRRKVALGMGNGALPKSPPEPTAAAEPAGPPRSPATSRSLRMRLQADRVIGELRELLILCGTADSAKAAALSTALNGVQDFRDHLGAVEMMQSARP
jgi:hypothetical protein